MHANGAVFAMDVVSVVMDDGTTPKVPVIELDKMPKNDSEGNVRMESVVPCVCTPIQYLAGPLAKYGAVNAMSWKDCALAEVVPPAEPVMLELASHVPSARYSVTMCLSVPTVSPLSTAMPVIFIVPGNTMLA